MKRLLIKIIIVIVALLALATPSLVRWYRESRAIGAYYDDFAQVSDDEVVALLAKAGHRSPDATKT